MFPASTAQVLRPLYTDASARADICDRDVENSHEGRPPTCVTQVMWA